MLLSVLLFAMIGPAQRAARTPAQAPTQVQSFCTLQQGQLSTEKLWYFRLHCQWPKQAVPAAIASTAVLSGPETSALEQAGFSPAELLTIPIANQHVLADLEQAHVTARAARTTAMIAVATLKSDRDRIVSQDTAQMTADQLTAWAQSIQQHDTTIRPNRDAHAAATQALAVKVACAFSPTPSTCAPTADQVEAYEEYLGLQGIK